MKKFKLAPDEVVRYQGQVTLTREKGDIPAELLLTNQNFVFITEGKKFLWFKNRKRTAVFAKDLVKIFKDAPQIKQSGTNVKICFTTEDREIVFDSKKAARTFVINAWEIVTGKNAFERGLDKLKQALDLADEALGLDIKALVKDSITGGIAGAVFRSIGGKKKGA